MKMVNHDLFMIMLLVNLLLFTQNDIALVFNGAALKLGILEDVGDDVDDLRAETSLRKLSA